MHMTSLADITKLDPWLEPYKGQLADLQQYIDNRSKVILDGSDLKDFATGHLHFGLHKTDDGWVLREWAPAATKIYLICEKTEWEDDESYRLEHLDDGEWEVYLPVESLAHGDTYKLHVYWEGGDGYRIPSYATYVVQDENTHDFSASVWSPVESHEWKHQSFKPKYERPLIYEAHVGMSGDREAVSTYRQFTEDILPRISALGYNTIQLMAIQEHPYYGSFGYHVSNYFAASSRSGTPDDLKQLIDTAHELDIAVILDVVHSHAVKNENEGLALFDGTSTQYFHEGDKGDHPAWDSKLFDYGKPQVVHFLLSNIRFWLEEYKFDGYRFDGVTSMLYEDHGLGRAFSSYDTYFEGLDKDAITYLSLANELVHSVNPTAVSIAEDMSAFPGLAAPKSAGGIGFDYRLSMGAPDIWIKTLKERRDEDWDLGYLFHELTARRPEERVISYAESHDQALVGDKTLIFRLIDKDMYWHMQADDQNPVVERGIALHKLIRLLTASTNGGGYLNFMGNEFGYPEWIDFPREGNEWSYAYARRQWSLVDDTNLKYHWLNEFDKTLVSIVKDINDPDFHYVNIDNDRKVLSFMRGNMLFAFNFSPTDSYADLAIPAKSGEYAIVASSDDERYGGHARVDTSTAHFSRESANGTVLNVYLPSRVAVVLAISGK